MARIPLYKNSYDNSGTFYAGYMKHFCLPFLLLVTLFFFKLTNFLIFSYSVALISYEMTPAILYHQIST